MEVLDRIRQNRFGLDDPDVNGYVAKVLREGLLDSDTALLADAMAHSGSTINLGEPLTDLPSTGGPASLSTLVVPLAAAIVGKKVLKVSVPGKPAGALDTLQTLPGYKADLDERELRDLASRSPYVHIAARGNFAPADGKIFEIRTKLKAKLCPELVIASLLSKKLCVACKSFVLDVRIGENGNIAASEEKALEFCKRFITVAQRLGLAARCVITDLRSTLQSPYIGRGESLRGLAAFFRGSLDEHSAVPLIRMTEEVLSVAGDPNPEQTIRVCLNGHPLVELERILTLHGVEPGAFSKRIQELENFETIPIKANPSGFITHIDLKKLKQIVLDLYALVADHQNAPIWEIGVFWLALHEVRAGEELCHIRCSEAVAHAVSARLADWTARLNNSVTVSQEGSADLPRVLVAIVDENLRVLALQT